MALINHPTNPLSEATIGAAIEVHRRLGPGLLESTYHACLCREMDLRDIPFRSKLRIPLAYKGIALRTAYVVDLVVDKRLVVELKSVEKLLPVHSAQLMTYMRLLDIPAGLLINFNVDLLPRGIERKLR